MNRDFSLTELPVAAAEMLLDRLRDLEHDGHAHCPEAEDIRRELIARLQRALAARRAAAVGFV